jgi:predicted nucleic acid-binding protein
LLPRWLATRTTSGLGASRPASPPAVGVLAELHALSIARRDRRFALDLVDRIEGSGVLIVRVSDGDWRQARTILGRYDDKDVSFTDALSFAVMDRLLIGVAFTFDQPFVQCGIRLADETL